MKIKSAKRFFGVILAAGLLGGMPAAVEAATYTIDPVHSFIQFRIKHLGFSWLLGRFNMIEGDFSFDPEAGASAQSISVTIDIASVDTNWAERDKHLRSADFFNVDEFPSATFKSTAYKGDADGGTLEGELTLHGVTKAISFPVSKIAEGDDPWGGYRAGFEGTYMMNRSDFDISYNLGPASETMVLELFIEGIREK